MKLIKVEKVSDGKHKYQAIFDNDGRQKTTKFGASGMDDYTITKDTEQRDRYRKRHSKDLKTGDPTRAGFLSYYLLWGDSTSFQTNLASYKKRFGL
jgi:ABC-type sulfate transport system substrate-binding protein